MLNLDREIFLYTIRFEFSARKIFHLVDIDKDIIT